MKAAIKDLVSSKTFKELAVGFIFAFLCLATPRFMFFVITGTIATCLIGLLLFVVFAGLIALISLLEGKSKHD